MTPTEQLIQDSELIVKWLKTSSPETDVTMAIMRLMDANRSMMIEAETPTIMQPEFY